MNETISLILATTILALSGVGLYMYKSSVSFEKDDDYDEDRLFNNSSSFFNWSKNDNNDNNDDIEEDYEYKSHKKSGIKTHKNRKTNGTSKRRY